jgi:hypothetical protein
LGYVFEYSTGDENSMWFKRIKKNMVAKMYRYYGERGYPTMYVSLSLSLSLFEYSSSY